MSASTARSATATAAAAAAAPFASQLELIAHALEVVRARLRAAGQQLGELSRAALAAPPWPAEVIAAEAAFDARAAAARDDLARFPLLQVIARHALTAMEQRVLWLLLAHELCPVTRQLVRALASDDAPGAPGASDPTTGVLRRAAIGALPTLEAWRVLVEDAPLRGLGLIERAGAADLPEYRQSWKIARRVLAIAHCACPSA